MLLDKDGIIPISINITISKYVVDSGDHTLGYWPFSCLPNAEHIKATVADIKALNVQLIICAGDR